MLEYFKPIVYTKYKDYNRGIINKNIMDYQLLQTFITVSDCGSFSKASDRLFISTTAIAKQMNLLEKETGLHLFNRTKRGTTLTKSGAVFYEGAKFISDYWNKMLERARNTELNDGGNYIRIGSSMLRSEKYLLDLWTKVKDSCPQYKIHIVPFEDNFQGYLEIIQNLGTEIDIIAANYPPDLWGGCCNVLKLADVPLCCAVSRYHALAQKKILDYEDLSGQELMIVHRGRSRYVDAVRDKLQQYPLIKLIDVPDYDVSIFNQCETTDRILLVTQAWVNVHPLLVTIPVKWEFTSPYGLLYGLNPTATVHDFIQSVQKIMEY